MNEIEDVFLEAVCWSDSVTVGNMASLMKAAELARLESESQSIYKDIDVIVQVSCLKRFIFL